MSFWARKLDADRSHAEAARPRHAPVVISSAAPAANASLQRQAHCACGGGCPRCQHDHAAASGERLAAPARKVEPFYSGQSDCSPTWFGDTSPEVDPGGGNFTGKLIVKYNDPEIKSPCVRACVEEHEAVHVAHLTPIVKKIRDCDVAAGNDWDKKEKCNAIANRELAAVVERSECEAYRKSFTCLTLKVLDSGSPCSKPPHREEVQKHRGYEACAMKRHCGAAGTPELGVPNA